MSTNIPSEIHAELHGLDAQQQNAVLEFLRRLKSAPTGTKGAELLAFAEFFLRRIRLETIEHDCGKVDMGEW